MIDYPNERYVRLYTGDYADQAAWCWQARALMPWLSAVADGAGIIATTKGPRGIAASTRLPTEVVGPGLAELLADGWIVELTSPPGYLIPTHVEAETAAMSNSQRQARFRDHKRSEAAFAEVTRRNAALRDVTDGNETQRNSTPVTEIVTPSRAEPSRAEREAVRPVQPQNKTPSVAVAPTPPPEPSPVPDRASRRAAAKRLVDLQEKLRLEIDPKARPVARIHCEDEVTVALGQHREEDLEHVLLVYAQEARAMPASERLKWFNGASNWRTANIERAKGVNLGGSRPNADGYVPPAPGTVFADGYEQAPMPTRKARP